MTDPPAAEVLLEDEHLVAVSKPAGLLTQAPPWKGPTLEDSVRRHLAPGAPGSVYLGTVHRLDRPVSGVVLWAKTPRAARRLSTQFASRRTVKEYWAVVEAAGVGEAEGAWEDWLTRSSDPSGVVHVVEPDAPDARQALTRYRVEPSARVPAGAVALRLFPETGRTHQLRAQAARRGWPIWGDTPYGAVRAFPAGIALHARALTFHHPALGHGVTVTAPLPETWAGQGFEWPEGAG